MIIVVVVDIVFVLILVVILVVVIVVGNAKASQRSGAPTVQSCDSQNRSHASWAAHRGYVVALWHQWPWHRVGRSTRRALQSDFLLTVEGMIVFVQDLVVQMGNGVILLWNIASRKVVDGQKHRVTEHAALTSARGSLLISAASDGDRFALVPMWLAQVKNRTRVAGVGQHDDSRLGGKCADERVREVVISEVRAVVALSVSSHQAESLILAIMFIAVLIWHAVTMAGVVPHEHIIGFASLSDGRDGG